MAPPRTDIAEPIPKGSKVSKYIEIPTKIPKNNPITRSLQNIDQNLPLKSSRLLPSDAFIPKP